MLSADDHGGSGHVVPDGDTCEQVSLAGRVGECIHVHVAPGIAGERARGPRIDERLEEQQVLGPFVAFFGTGFFSGFSAIASELFPTEVRATAMGLSYNLGRGLSAAAPAIVGLLASRFGLGSAFFLQAAAFFAAALLALTLPETKGKQLD